MKTIKTAVALFHCCILFTFSAQAKSPVWKISKGDNHLFVGGTIHVLSASDYPLPEAFDTGYNKSEVLVLEADIQKIKTPEMQQAFVQTAMYAGDTIITHFLQPGTAQELKAHLASRGIPPEQMLKFKPGLLSVTLLAVELQRLGLAGTGVDEFYNLKALHEKRKIKYLEDAAEQLQFIAEMGKGKEDEFIQYTLKDMNELPTVLQALKDAWRNGNNTKLQTLIIEPLQKSFPKIYTMLQVDRNNMWLPQIEAMLATGEVELVLVGSLHLAGDDGILSLLKKRGCTIENM